MIEISLPFRETKAERRRRYARNAAIAAGAVAAGAVVAWRLYDRLSGSDDQAPERRAEPGARGSETETGEHRPTVGGQPKSAKPQTPAAGSSSGN